MKRLRHHLPLLVTVLLSSAALRYGPIAQLADYHDFADQSTLAGLPHAADVLSNAGFALIALWGWRRLSAARQHPALRHGWGGYRLFLAGLFFTAIGSSFYHLAPDNARLVWDRLPIALACAGLLAGVRGDARRQDSSAPAAWFALYAVASVAWWHVTETAGAGDLRPYLLLQALPMLLVPLWLWIHKMPRADCRAFGGALLLYAIAKLAELNDHRIAALTGALTGHTLKHLLAGAAAALIIARLAQRTQEHH
jgi:hypothetical protein